MLSASRRLAVIGHPIGHSRSPAMHNAAFEALGLAGEWSYEALDFEPQRFEERTRQLPGRGFVGANVTIPHKRAALALADEASAAATEIGAANTLSFAGSAIRADNTDGPGLLAALPDSPHGRRALVLGAGGSARAVVWALVGEGAEVAVWNRTPERAERLAAELGATALLGRGPLASRDFHLVVNATSVGMGGRGGLAELGLAADGFRSGQVVVDLVYGSEPTALLRAAAESGARTVDGLELLVQQGAASFRIWTGIDPPLEVMRAAARA